jgi:hypothetical protein
VCRLKFRDRLKLCSCRHSSSVRCRNVAAPMDWSLYQTSSSTRGSGTFALSLCKTLIFHTSGSCLPRRHHQLRKAEQLHEHKYERVSNTTCSSLAQHVSIRKKQTRVSMFLDCLCFWTSTLALIVFCPRVSEAKKKRKWRRRRRQLHCHR